MTEIEKGIPIPSSRRAVVKYPCDIMEPGDSFLMPPGKTTRCTGHVLKYWSNKTGYVFTARNVIVDGEKRARVWRVY